MIPNILTKIFGSRNERLLKQYGAGSCGRSTRSSRRSPRCPTTSCAARPPTLKERVANGEELDAVLPEAFAVVREAGKRTLQMRHFDVQLIGGMVLHNGKIAEMRTGEGKTLVATLPAYLNALTGNGVHIVTVNDYLAQRDADWMGRIYRFLGLDRRRQPVADGARRQAGRLRRRHHLRHQQRIRLRLPARQHGVRGGGARAARPHLRDRRRSRLDPDRRGAHAAHHLRPGRRQRRPLLPAERARAEARAAGGGDRAGRLLGRREGAPGAAVRGGPRARRGASSRRPGCSPPAAACTTRTTSR